MAWSGILDEGHLVAANPHPQYALEDSASLHAFPAPATLSAASDATATELNSMRAVLFDQSADQSWYESAYYPLNLPASTIKLRIAYSASAIGGDVRLEVSIGRRQDGLELGSAVFDGENVEVVTVPGSSNTLDVVDITLTNDHSIAPGDFFIIRIRRNGVHVDDTLTTGDVYVYMAVAWVEV